MNVSLIEVKRFDLAMIRPRLTALRQHYFESISLEEKLFLIGQLETGFSVGIPILQVIQMIEKDVQNPEIVRILGEIRNDVSQGESLHSAFSKHPTLFDPATIGLIKVGEESGELEQVLGRVSKMLDQKATNRAKIKSATFYPKLVVGVMVIVVFVVVTFVIPKIRAVIVSMGGELPFVTRMVVGASDFALRWGWALAIAALLAREAFVRWVRTDAGRLRFDTWKLKAPVFGKLYLFLEINNFCVVLDLLIGSGLPLMDALVTVRGVQDNENIRRDIDSARAAIARGGSLADGLSESRWFPSSFRSLIAIGDETGRMQSILQRMGRYYQVQVDYRLENLSKLLEPILLAIIFGMVTILALAIFLPVWKMSSLTPK
jgi:type II secretory pathway component PulF